MTPARLLRVYAQLPKELARVVVMREPMPREGDKEREAEFRDWVRLAVDCGATGFYARAVGDGDER